MSRILFIILLLFSTYLGSQNNVNNKYFVCIEGKVKESKSKMWDASITVYNNDTIIKTIKTDSTGRYKLNLNRDTVYIIEVAKQGYVSKKFEINTKKIPKERLNKPINKISAETELHKKILGVDYSYFKKPLIKFFYDKEREKMEINKAHFENSQEAQFRIFEKEKKCLMTQNK